MIKIIGRTLIVVLIAMLTAFGTVKVVNYVIVHTNLSFESWTQTFTWLRYFSSLGLIGVVAHVIPFFLATVIILGIEKLY